MAWRRFLLATACALAPFAAGAQAARIFFIDVGQGSATLVVSPTGKTLLVDGGPAGAGTNKISPLLTTLGIATLDYTVLTHYHIDHDTGLTEMINAGKVSGTAFDNGDGIDVVPPAGSSTYTAYADYRAAITAHPAVLRQTIQPGQVIDLGGGMRATCLVARGLFLSGAAIPVTTDDLNTQSISLLVQYNNFSFLVSGDLTGGGATRAARTLELETFVAQLAGDVDAAAAGHHGSLTASNRKFLRAVKAEVMVASAGETNFFGHPAKEIANRYLNTPVTNGGFFAGAGAPAPGAGPVFYQTEASPSGATAQGWSGAAAGVGGSGTLLLATDGTTNYSLKSFDDNGVRINPAQHLYPLDAVNGVTLNFPPTVIPSLSPVVPLATGAVTVSAKVNDREDPIASVTLNYSLNGVAQTPVAMALSGGFYTATIPAQPGGMKADLAISAVAGGATTTAKLGYFSGVTPVAALKSFDAAGEPVAFDYAARIRATVTAGSGVFTAGPDRLEAMEDAGGGLMLFYATTAPTGGPAATCAGQSVEASGRLATDGGQLELDVTPDFATAGTPYGVAVLSSGGPPAPATVTLAQLLAAPESWEGRLVRVANARVTSGTIPAAPASADAFLNLNDGTATGSMKIFAESDIPGLATPASPFTLVGVVTQDDGLRPFTAGYAVAPRHRPDLGAPQLLPAFVTAKGGNSSVVVNWENTLQSGNYRIERASGGCAGAWAPLATQARAAGASNSYTDLAVAAGTAYCYRVVPLTDACGGGTPTACNGSMNCAVPVAGSGGACAPGVVISQLFGGGGNSGAPYLNDFVELHNRTSAAISLAGWAIQYGSATGTGGWLTTPLSGAIAAGGYFLVAEASGGTVGAPLPAPDATGAINFSNSAGKVALTSTATALNGACPASAAIVDLLGYSSTANCSETAPAPALTASTALLRAAAGCGDTNNNAADFSAVTPAPRNGASTALLCNCAPAPPAEVSSAAAGLPLKVTKNGDGSLNLDFEDLTGATGFNLYAGTISNFYSHGGSPGNRCAVATTVPATGLRRAAWPAGGAPGYFLVTGYNGVGEGTAGFAFSGAEIPPAQSSCPP